MGEGMASAKGQDHRAARLLVEIGDATRRKAVTDALSPDGYEFLARLEDHGAGPLLIVAESHMVDPAWSMAPSRPRVVLLDTAAADAGGIADDWIPVGTRAIELCHRVRLNAEIAVLRRQLQMLGAGSADAVRQRIKRLEQGLQLLQDAHRTLERQLAEAREREAKARGSLPPAAVLHELRTPLNAISGFSEIMKTEAYGPLGHDKYRDYVSTIHDATTHLMDVVNDLIEVYSLESDHIRVAPKSIDLRRTVIAVTGLLTAQAELAGVELVADMDVALPTLETDEGRLRQVLVNLVGNAIKFTPAGGRVSVRIVREPVARTVTVKVKDTGIGIAPGRLPKVAQPYSRGEPGPGAPEGSGLGLSIAKFMVEKLGGQLGIASALGTGTEVSITLPMNWREPDARVH